MIAHDIVEGVFQSIPLLILLLILLVLLVQNYKYWRSQVYVEKVFSKA